MKIIRAPQLVRVTRRYRIRLANAPYAHEGASAHLVGHCYVLEVGLTGIPLSDTGHPQDGMVMDLMEVDRIVQEHVLAHYDHAVVLHEAHRPGLAESGPLFARARFAPWQPTSENLLLDILARLRPHMPVEVELDRLRLKRSKDSWAEWEA